MNKQITHEQLKEALEFFDYNIAEGIYDETILVGLDDNAIYNLFINENNRAEYMAEQAEDEYLEAMQENMEEAQATGN
jgi:hypothetical protein